MTTQARPASARQLAYMNRLRTEIGQPEVAEHQELTSAEASEAISEMIARSRQNGTQKSVRRINEPRLGMAMKECYRTWTGLGRDVWNSSRQAFVQEVIRTYELFSEIAEKMENQSTGGGP